MKDAELREKIQQVDALTGGVVYGKEEAWEKLQTRLDKPAKVIVFPYRLVAVAAALLLLCVGVYWVIHPAAEVESPYPQALAPAPVSIPQPNEDQPPVVNTTPVVSLIPTAQPRTEKQSRYIISKPQQPEIIKYSQPDNNEVVTVEPDIVPPNLPPPVKKMRVVHINDIGHPEGETHTQAIVYTGPALDISKMKVVSIYEVQLQQQMHRQQEEVIAIARLHKPIGLFSTASLSKGPNTPFAANLFSIQLNRKN